MPTLLSVVERDGGPPAECDSLGCLTSLPPLDIVWLFHFPTSGCLVVFNSGFNLHFLDDGPW